MTKIFKHLLVSVVGIFALSAVADAALVQSNANPTARPGVVSTVVGSATSRMPTLRINGTNVIGGTILNPGTGTSIVTVTDKECVDNYTSCITEDENCGPNFENCTTKPLFFAAKNACTSTLLACSSNGVNLLMGTTNPNILATTDCTTLDVNGDCAYVYPTDNSIMGSMIAGSAIANRLDTSDCVRKYTQCLNRDDVCGSDFALCTTNSDFKKQKVFCGSTLSMCQAEGIMELWGTSDTTANPVKPGRLRDMIDEGAQLAAVNAVSTCYKIADNCILKACTDNPYLCKEGTDQSLICAASAVVDPTNPAAGCTDPDDIAMSEPVNASAIKGIISNACADTIGGNQYCYTTVNGKVPTASELKDEYNQSDVFDDLYSSRFASSTSMKAKIDDLINQFDAKMKQKCSDTIVSCAQRTCGGGSGIACYNAATLGSMTSDNPIVDIVNDINSIRNGCAAIVNQDQYCAYVGARFNPDTGAYTFEDVDLFGKLFTSPTNTDVKNPDPTGAVAILNAKLATSYSPTAMAKMTTSCQAAASQCVRQQCGSDFSNCYRNRTDIMSTITNTGIASLNNSMNKVGGILDRTIAIGLCMDTVQNNSTCKELLTANTYHMQNSNVSNGDADWGKGDNMATSVGAGWIDAGTQSASSITVPLEGQCSPDNNVAAAGLAPTADCGDTATYTDENGTQQTATYNTPANDATTMNYAMNLATTQIFTSVLSALDIEAQAKYNAALTQEQNQCFAGNSAGGVMGVNDTGSTFAWVKLTSSRVPDTYSTMGLKDTQFKSSNELYGSFCRIRVTIQSDDPWFRQALQGDVDGINPKNWATAYFAAGDAFTCGSWIPEKDLNDLSSKYANSKTGTNSNGSLKNGQGWLVAGTTLLGVVGGGLAGNALAGGNGLGGLLGGKNKKVNPNELTGQDKTDYYDAQECVQAMDAGITGSNDFCKETLVANGKYSYNTYDCSFDPSNVVGVETATHNMSRKRITCQNAMDQLTDPNRNANLKDSGSNTGEILATVGGAVAGGGILGVATGQILKSSNRSKWTAAQQDWYNNVGEHIQCYIGGDNVGTFGDAISTSLEQ